MRIVLVFDIVGKCTRPAIARLTPKAYSLLLYLGLRRTDTSDGWVDVVELVQRVPFWIGQKERTAGSEVGRYATETRWFERYVAYGVKHRGPYRLLDPAEFLPSRDAANGYVARQTMAIRPQQRHQSPKRSAKRRIAPIELQAYDMLVQHGVFLPPVVDLIQQRLGDGTDLSDPVERLVAIRILVTMHKQRGTYREGMKLALAGLRLAKKMRRVDDAAYLLDQLGGLAGKLGNRAAALRYFEEEIAFLKQEGGPRSSFHLAGAYRGLAMTFGHLGNIEAVRSATAESRKYAQESGNDEALRMAEYAETRQASSEMSPIDSITAMLGLPTEHLTARVMAINVEARLRLEAGELETGLELLSIAQREAKRLGFGGELTKAQELATRYGLKLE